MKRESYNYTNSQRVMKHFSKGCSRKLDAIGSLMGVVGRVAIET